MKKPLRLVVAVLLALSVTALSGCFPKLKDGANLTPPSWKVPVQVPLVKKTFVLGDILADLDIPEMENIKIDQDSKLLSFVKQFQPEPLTLDIPDLSQAVNEFDLPPVEWTSGAFAVNIPNSYNVTFNHNIDLGIGDIYIPTQAIQLNPDTLIEIPFESIKLSDSNINSIHFTLTSDEPIDGLTLQLVDTMGNPIGQVVDFGFVAGGSTSVPQYTRTRTLDLSGQAIPRQMKFRLDLMVHSTSGNIRMDIAMNDQLEVVELIPVANDPDNPLIKNIPQITVPAITPLADFDQIQEIHFTSGIIRFRQTRTHTPDHPFPFNVRLDQLKINGDSSRFYQDTNGDICLNLSDLILTPTTTISGADVALVNNPVYDVWDDAANQLIPYLYNLSFIFENVEIDSIKGNASMISDLIPDPNPATPGKWDYILGPVASGIQEITYPAPVQDFAINLTDLFLTMNMDNDTSLRGDFSMKLVVYANQAGQPLVIDGKPVEASFTVHVEPRSETHFEFADQSDYSKFIAILNSKPRYIEYIYQGNLDLPEMFTLTSRDSVTTGFSVSLPLSLSIGAGGARIPKVYEDTMTLSASQRDLVKQACEFIDEAKLNIRYNNETSLGLGGTLTFSTQDGRTETVESVIFNNRTGVATLTVTRNLLDILQNETGFTLSYDMLIPNDTGTSRMMSLKASDQLGVTVWLDAKVRAHVPNQQ